MLDVISKYYEPNVLDPSNNEAYMEMIEKSKAAVFYVDILGMGALTKQELKLTRSDYIPWLKKNRDEFNPEYLAAAILAEFRRILTSLIPKYRNVTVSQLSDCAFIWSADICAVVKFAAEFMQIAITQQYQVLLEFE